MSALPSVDLHLSRQLERTEGRSCAHFVESRASVDPAVGAEWIEVAGCYAMFDGVGSPITQTFGLGVFEPFGVKEFERVEEFFTARGATTAHETSPFAPEVTVRLLDPGEGELWARVAAEGWSSEGEGLASFVEQIGRVTARAKGAHCFLAEAGGEPIAAAGLNLNGEIALMAGASTIPTGRRRGAQNALFHARLAFAAAHGHPLAMVVTQPDSASQRNAERQGFRPMYTRTKWERPLPSA